MKELEKENCLLKKTVNDLEDLVSALKVENEILSEENKILKGE